MMAWPEVELGNVCEFEYGKSLAADNRDGGPFPVYGSNGIVGWHSKTVTDGPTIVIGRKGSFGEVAFSETPCWPIDTTYYVDATATKADLKWLSYRLGGLGLTQLNRAAAIPGLNRDDAYRQRLLLPPLNEQRRIAAILDHADALRTKRREVLAHLDTLTQSIFRDRFGDPKRNARGLPVHKLGDLGLLDRGVSKHRPRNDSALLGGTYPLIQTGDVANSGGYITSFSATYSDLGLAQSRLWPAGTLCITIAANIAKTGILAFDACFPDSVVGFSADPETTTYIRVWLSFLQATLEASAPQSAQKNINLAVLRMLDVPMPNRDEVVKFASRIEAVKVQRELAVAAQGAHATLFASLQTRAFGGELGHAG